MKLRTKVFIVNNIIAIDNSNYFVEFKFGQSVLAVALYTEPSGQKTGSQENEDYKKSYSEKGGASLMEAAAPPPLRYMVTWTGFEISVHHMAHGLTAIVP